MDKLTEYYNEWAKTGGDNFQAFQAGLTVGASSMRTRAMKCFETTVKGKDPQETFNNIKNAVGQLSDIG